MARWNYHFGSQSAESLLYALSAYQNDDGGFGHGIEPDCWNPNSTPIQTWAAYCIISEIPDLPHDHPTITGICRYLESGQDFNGSVWTFAVASNNAHPHAPWWNYSEPPIENKPSVGDYNPSAALAGVGLLYSPRNTSLWSTCRQIAQQATELLLSSQLLDNGMLVMCFAQLYECLMKAGIDDVVDLSRLRQNLMQQVQHCVSKDTTAWSTSYVTKPSHLLNSPCSFLYPAIKELADYECYSMLHSRNEDGIWDVTWSWADYPNEWAISKQWWQGSLAVSNMLYLRNFGFIEP